jgi:hypothetical protein
MASKNSLSSRSSSSAAMMEGLRDIINPSSGMTDGRRPTWLAGQ